MTERRMLLVGLCAALLMGGCDVGFLQGSDDETIEDADSADETKRPARRRRRKKRKRAKSKKAVASPEPAATPDPVPDPEPKPPPPPPPPELHMPSTSAIRTPKLSAGVTASDFRKVFMQNEGRLKRCLEDSLDAKEKFGGTLIMQLTIDRFGKVLDAHFRNRGVDDLKLARCAVRAVSAGGYPALGKSVTITLPLKVVRFD